MGTIDASPASAMPTPAAQARTASADASVRTRTPDGWILTGTDGLTPQELYGILQLRSRVFVVEQECLYTDMDGLDLLPGTQHLLLPADQDGPRPAADAHGGTSGFRSEPLAYARILPLEVTDGPAARPGARSVGRVVTSPEGHGRGLGRRLLDEVVRLFGHGDLTLNAQAHLSGYYGRAGFRVSGPEFLEDGIPHLPMYRPGEAEDGESPS